MPSCATIVSKSSWPVSINSNPPGANLIVVNKSGQEVFKGNTPANLNLNSGSGYFTKEKYKVKFSMNGYADKEVELNCSLNGWYIGNLIFGGVIGFLIVDPASGAMYKLDLETLNETLIKSTSSLNHQPSLKIYSINDIPDDMKSHLIKIN